jgi:hypothetical protein
MQAHNFVFSSVAAFIGCMIVYLAPIILMTALAVVLLIQRFMIGTAVCMFGSSFFANYFYLKHWFFDPFSREVNLSAFTLPIFLAVVVGVLGALPLSRVRVYPRWFSLKFR